MLAFFCSCLLSGNTKLRMRSALRTRPKPPFKNTGANLLIRGFCLTLSCFLLATLLVVAASSVALAQGSGVSQIAGTVNDAQGRPIRDAQVRLSGPASEAIATATDGSFAFNNVPAGIYRLDISKSGFIPTTQADIVLTAASTTRLVFTLPLVSLTTIGAVSTSAHRADAINTSPAAIVDVPGSTFVEQGRLSVNQVLNEVPGITVGLTNVAGGINTGANGASPLQVGVPSIRGGLPYETESLIDGHAVSLGQFGFFSPSFLSPYLLQNVEVVKGPGATSPSINYAINGTVNYRTLEPTVKRQESADFGIDQFGGNFANLRATGTLPGGRLSYAFDYLTAGTQGPDRGLTLPSIFLAQGPAFLNGSPINLNAKLGQTAGPSNIQNSFNLSLPIMSITAVPQVFNARNQLAKIRYAFTPSTTLTLTWLGYQSMGTTQSVTFGPYGNFFFSPPSGYTGAIPAGLQPEALLVSPTSNQVLLLQNTNLFEGEFHTPLGKTATLSLRQYSSAIQTFQGGPGYSGPTAAGPETYTGPLYGAIYYGATNSTVPTIFNGQVGTISVNAYSEYRTYNYLNGYTAEVDKQAGNALLSLSYDYEKTSTLANQDLYGAYSTTIPGGSSQAFQSVMARGQFAVAPRVDGTLSDNYGIYTDNYTQNGGFSYLQSTHSYQAPRLSLTWRPNVNQSVRASAGLSIAPPYIALLNNTEVIAPVGVPPTSFSKTGNSGSVLPETAFGYNLGFDTRIAPFSVLSVDLYQTVLHNQFLTQTSADGTYTCTTRVACGGVTPPFTEPLYVTQTINLGHSQYDGVELSLHRTPPSGLGYRIQGSLQRAFVYDLPAGFYNTASCSNCTNLAVLPNINFQTSGAGYNGLGFSRVPYSTGYGEINYRWHNGAHVLAGVTYYGPNNSYGQPAFGVVNASFDQPLTRRMSLQLSIYNVTNAYSDSIIKFYANSPTSTPILTPLENGKLGYTTANVVGPSTANLTLHIRL